MSSFLGRQFYRSPLYKFGKTNKIASNAAQNFATIVSIIQSYTIILMYKYAFIKHQNHINKFLFKKSISFSLILLNQHKISFHRHELKF